MDNVSLMMFYLLLSNCVFLGSLCKGQFHKWQKWVEDHEESPVCYWLQWQWGGGENVQQHRFSCFEGFFLFDLGFLIEISESVLSECIPYKNPEKDTEHSPKMWINTKPSLCVHSIILISACCFHARICWALWAVSCTWGMSSLLLMSRGMLRSPQKIRLNTWPGWVSPVREIPQERRIVEDSLLGAWYHHIILDCDLEVLIKFTSIWPKWNANILDYYI